MSYENNTPRKEEPKRLIAQGQIKMLHVADKGQYDNYCVLLEGEKQKFFLNRWGSPIPIYLEGEAEPLDPVMFQGRTVYGSVMYTTKTTAKGKLVYDPIAIQVEEEHQPDIEVELDELYGNPFSDSVNDPIEAEQDAEPISESESESSGSPIHNLNQIPDRVSDDTDRKEQSNDYEY